MSARVTGIPIHPKMICIVTKIEYDYASKQGTVWSPAHNVPDMAGSISTFEAIDPEVQEIRHFEGTHVTSTFLKTGGKWEARLDE